MMKLWIHLPVWRELKPSAALAFKTSSPRLWIHLPVWRELKLLRTQIKVLYSWSLPLDTPSRLKGIETLYRRQLCSLLRDWLWIHLPVWRELKHLHSASLHGKPDRPLALDTPSRLKGIETSTFLFTPAAGFVTLDTPSRLKGIETLPRVSTRGDVVGKGHGKTLDTPSRLKGIETINTAVRAERPLPCFGYTFPFEGNWNHEEAAALQNSIQTDFGYTFPFEGNWNVKVITDSNTRRIHFQCAFPFEGNWNICCDGTGQRD